MTKSLSIKVIKFFISLLLLKISTAFPISNFYYIKDLNNNYVLNKDSNNKAIFFIESLPDNSVTLKTDKNNFLSSNQYNQNFEPRKISSSWENFKLIPTGNESFLIQTFHSSFINISNQGIGYNIIHSSDHQSLILEEVNDCKNDSKFYLKTNDGYYLQNNFNTSNDFYLSKDKYLAEICINYIDKNTFSIKINNKYLSANSKDIDVNIVARDWNSAWETFRLKREKDNFVSIKTFHNSKLSLQKNKDMSFKLIQSTNIRDHGENFYLIPAEKNKCNPENLYFLQSINSKQKLQNGYDNSIHSFKFSNDNNNFAKICIENKDYKNISLKLNNSYLSANNYDDNIVERENNLGWETFTIDRNLFNKISIKTIHGTFLEPRILNSRIEVLKQTKDLNFNFELVSVYPNSKSSKIENNKCYFITKNNSVLTVNSSKEVFVENNSYKYNSIFCIERNQFNKIFLKNILKNEYLAVNNNVLNLDKEKTINSEFLTKSLKNGKFSFTNGNNSITLNENSVVILDKNYFNENLHGLSFIEVNPLMLRNQDNNIELQTQKNIILNDIKNIKVPSFANNRLTNIPEKEFNIHDICPVPRIGTYEYSTGGLEVYCIKIPQIFNLNIPSEIKNELIRYNIVNFDIFLLAQNKYIFPLLMEENGKVNLVRAHYWINSLNYNGQKISKIPAHYNGSIFNRNILISLYNSSDKINLSKSNNIIPDTDVLTNYLKPFVVSIHDNAISPNNAHTALAEVQNKNFSFYSLVIDPVSKRAAVTLHWLIDFDTFENLQNVDLNKNYSLNDLINLHSRDRSLIEPIMSLKDLLR